MEALLKLPENWHVVVTDENRELLKKWFRKYYPDADLTLDFLVGMAKHKDGTLDWLQDNEVTSKWWDFGQEISTADFKRLVLGEKNYEDYGVVGCEELKEYFKQLDDNDYWGGGYKHLIYFLKDEDWYADSNEMTNRQTLPLSEYLKLLEKTETMEKKYEYKLKDEKHRLAVDKITQNENLPYEKYYGQSLNPECLAVRTLKDYNVLDLFFDKVEVVELPVINGDRVEEKGDWLNICGCDVHKDWIIKSNFKSFTLHCGNFVSEEHLNQIRKYLNK